MKRFTFSLVVHEGSDESWEEIMESSDPGKELRDDLAYLLEEHGYVAEGKYKNVDLTLVEVSE